MSRNVFTALLAALIFSLVSCAGGTQENSEQTQTDQSVAEQNTPLGQASVQDNVSDANILQVAIGSTDHSTLVKAVQAAQIEHVLVNAGPLTVFAPVNAAFEALPEGALEDLLKPENKPTLAGILTGHAAPGSYDPAALRKESTKGRKIYMANGAYLEVTMQGDDVFVGGAKILGTVQTSNGIINVVDKVIIPKS
ncbi:MAG: fasciclin domain-containing protein [Flavobacteriales bacterium]|nr:fasciclin domain-containing protein [Flavobacteriales bacterium]